MTLPDLSNIGVFLLMGPVVVLAQATDTSGSVTAALTQIGAVGVVMAWLTMIHLPAQSKAAEKREEAAEKREASWRSSMDAQFTRAENERARLTSEHEKTMMRVADALAGLATAKADQARALDELAEEIRADRSRR